MKYNDEARMKEQIDYLLELFSVGEQDTHISAVVQLSRMGPQAVPYLIKILSTNPPYALRLCNVLGMIADERAIPVLSSYLPKSNAVTALAKIGSPEALTLIINNLPKWYEKWDRSNIPPESVFSYFEGNGIAQLKKELNITQDPLKKASITRILTEISSIENVDDFKKLMFDDNAEVRVLAIEKIRKLQYKESINDLMKILGTLKETDKWSEGGWGRSTTLKRAVTDALSELGDDKVAFEFLKLVSEKKDANGRFTSHESHEDVSNYEEALLKMKERAMPALIRGLQEGDEKMQKISSELITKIKTGKNVYH